MATILVVDDRPINREFLSALLGYAGHDVFEASNGSEALDVCMRLEFDLVVSDILMPEMDGIELVHGLRERPETAGVPVMFYTATYRLSEARELAAKCGVSTVIAKPSEPQVILDAVHAELALPQQLLESQRLPALGGSPFGHAADRLCVTATHEITGLKRQIEDVVSLDDSPSGKARRLYGLSAHIDESLRRAQALSIRLAALVELSLDLASERKPERMLELFCHAARDIMNARIATVCMMQDDGKQPQHVATWGMSKAQAAHLHFELEPTRGLLGELMRDGNPRRVNDVAGDLTALGLTESHPPINCLVAAPVKTDGQVYGWFYVADRMGDGQFQVDDEQIAVMLASTLAPHYENLVLYDRLMRNIGVLEIETEQRKAALEQLETSELRFRQLAENIREVFFLIDAENGEMLYVSPLYAEIWERSVESLYAAPDSWLDAVHPDDYEFALAQFQKMRESGRFNFEYRLTRSDGSIRWIKSRGFPIEDTDGRVYRIAGLAEDITEAKSQALRIQRLSRIHAVLSDINSAIVRIHEQQPLLAEACRIAVEHGGFPVAWIGLVSADGQRLGVSAHAGVDGDIAARFALLLKDAVGARESPVGIAFGEKRPVIVDPIPSQPANCPALQEAHAQGYGAMCVLPLLVGDEPAGVMTLFSLETGFFDEEELGLLTELAGDVSFALRHIAQAERLSYLAYYDPLTGLANTTLFQERLAQLVDGPSGKQTAVFLLDIDRFTDLNDSLGRNVGDDMLFRVARRLRRAIPESRGLARVGSDSFAIAVPALHQETDARTVLQEKILAALQRPFAIGETEIRLSARAGIAVFPRDGREPHTLLGRAEAALKEAKGSGARYQFYSPDLRARVSDELALEQKLLRAVEDEQFTLHYQPKIDANTRALIGLEALIRWQSEDEGLVSPNRFIPALEHSELILDVGRWAIERALSDVVQWRAIGLTVPPVSVNVSAVQLRYADFTDMVIETVGRTGASAEDLDLEITESVIMNDIETNQNLLQELSARGIKISIDDFGTGYSSLRYLSRLPVNALKIDRSFIDMMTTDSDSMTMISTMIALAHAFGLEVVAEGVESEEQAKLLRLMKCDSMQGYLFGKPRPGSETEELLRRDEMLGPRLSADEGGED